MEELMDDFRRWRRALAAAKVALLEAKVDLARIRASLLNDECAGMKNERVEAAAIEMHPQYMVAVDAVTKANREVINAQCELDIMLLALRLVELEFGAQPEREMQQMESTDATETE